MLTEVNPRFEPDELNIQWEVDSGESKSTVDPIFQLFCQNLESDWLSLGVGAVPLTEYSRDQVNLNMTKQHQTRNSKIKTSKATQALINRLKSSKTSNGDLK